VSSALLAALLAPLVGSFGGVLVRRLPAGQPWIRARSACETCGRRLSPAELVPLLSFAVLRGRCAGCRAPIALFHPLMEAASLAVVGLVLLARPPEAAALWAGCGLGWCCLVLAATDWQCLRLPDGLTLPLLLAGLGVTGLLAPAALGDHAAASLLGWLFFAGLAWCYRHGRGVDGLGAGDAKLLAAGGAWLGTGGLPTMVLVAALATLAGLLAVGAARGRMPTAGTRVPFGPGLAAALFGCWLWQM